MVDRVVRDYDDDDATGTLTCLTGEPYYRVKEMVLELEAEASPLSDHRLEATRHAVSGSS